MAGGLGAITVWALSRGRSRSGEKLIGRGPIFIQRTAEDFKRFPLLSLVALHPFFEQLIQRASTAGSEWGSADSRGCWPGSRCSCLDASRILSISPSVVGYALACPAVERSSPRAASPHDDAGQAKAYPTNRWRRRTCNIAHERHAIRPSYPGPAPAKTCPQERGYSALSTCATSQRRRGSLSAPRRPCVEKEPHLYPARHSSGPMRALKFRAKPDSRPLPSKIKRSASG